MILLQKREQNSAFCNPLHVSYFCDMQGRQALHNFLFQMAFFE